MHFAASSLILPQETAWPKKKKKTLCRQFCPTALCISLPCDSILEYSLCNVLDTYPTQSLKPEQQLEKAEHALYLFVAFCSKISLHHTCLFQWQSELALIPGDGPSCVVRAQIIIWIHECHALSVAECFKQTSEMILSHGFSMTSNPVHSSLSRIVTPSSPVTSLGMVGHFQVNCCGKQVQPSACS